MLPNVPMLARVRAKRNSFSLRIDPIVVEPSVKRRYSKLRSAAVPVVAGLRGCILQIIEVLVDSEADAGARALLVGVTIAEKDTVLVKIRRRSDPGRIRRKNARYAEEHVASADEDVSDSVIDECGAGVDRSQAGVVVEFPLNIGVGRRLDAEFGDDRGPVSRSGKEREAGKFGAAGHHVALSSDDCVAEGRVEKVLSA